MKRHLQKKVPAVFLDRDGVINEMIFDPETGMIESPFTLKQFKIKEGVGKAIGQINRMGFKAVVVSNQPGIAMRHFSKETLRRIDHKMVRELKRTGAHLDGVFYCFHHPTRGFSPFRKSCACRKPKAGLLHEAARRLNLCLTQSYMVGDTIYDVAAGKRAGCKTFLTAHLKCTLCDLMARKGIKPNFIVKDLPAAVKILKRMQEA